MKKTDLEKLKGKKLDIRRSQESGLDRQARQAAAKAAGGAPAPAGLLGKLLRKVPPGGSS